MYIRLSFKYSRGLPVPGRFARKIPPNKEGQEDPGTGCHSSILPFCCFFLSSVRTLLATLLHKERKEKRRSGTSDVPFFIELTLRIIQKIRYFYLSQRCVTYAILKSTFRLTCLHDKVRIIG